MSGTPESTEFYLNGKASFLPVGRADMGRTPFLWRTDVYAEYNLKIAEKYTLQFNANIYNLTNNRIPLRHYNRYNQEGVWLTDEQIAAGFDYKQVSREEDLILDPRYGNEFYFQSPISIRLGVKFLF